MSKFFEKVATPETQFRQSAAPAGPDVDVNARQDIANKQQTSLASAVNDLLGITAGVVSAKSKMDEMEYEDMRKRHDLDASNDVLDSGAYIKSYIDNKDAGRRIEDYDTDELQTLTEEATAKFIESKQFGDKNYFSLIKDKLAEKNSVFLEKQSATNFEYKKNKRYDVLSDELATVFKAGGDVKDKITMMQERLDEVVGPDAAIQDTQGNAKLRILQRLMHDAIGSRDIGALKTLKAGEMKEFFDIPDYENAVQVLEKQTQSRVNEMRQVSKDRLEEEVYLGIQSNGFSSSKQVDQWFNDQLDAMPEEQRPDTKDILKLKADAMEAMEEQVTYEAVYKTVKGGDSTFMERSGMKKKQRDTFKNKMFMDETGLDDLSPEGIERAVNSGSKDAALKSFFNQFGSVPPALALYGETAPSGGIEALKTQRNTFMNLSVITEGTPVSLENIYSPNELTRMNYIGKLLDDADAGIISEAEASQAYRNFNNDLKKNTDSFGNYVSSRAADYLHDEDTKEWLTENVKDASWTTDEYSAQSYRKRQFTHYFSLAMENTDDPKVAREQAEKMFAGGHRDVEAPNGEETVLPREYMSHQVKDFLKVAKNHQAFNPFRAVGYLGTGLGSETYFDRSISFAPDASYEKNKIMNMYYGEGLNKKLVLSVTPEKFEKMLEAVNEKIISEAKSRRRARMEKEKLNK